MAENQQRGFLPFDAIQQEQLNIYAAELSKLYALLRSRSKAWLETEERLRTRGTHTNTIYQLLSAAYMCSQLMLEGKLSPKTQQAVAERLRHLLERALATMREYRRETGMHVRQDLGLAALLREKAYGLASEYGWDIQVETEKVHLSPLSEMAAYLIVEEALQRAALDPHMRRITLTLKMRGHRLVTKVIAYSDGTGPGQSPAEDTGEGLLTRLYARLAGGNCRWRTVSDSAAVGGMAAEMELTLPLGGEQTEGAGHSLGGF